MTVGGTVGAQSANHVEIKSRKDEMNWTVWNGNGQLMQKALSSLARDGADAGEAGTLPAASLPSFSSPVSLSQILRAGDLSQGRSERAAGLHAEPREDASMGHGASCFKPASAAPASSTALSANCSVTSFTPLQHSQHFIRNSAQNSANNTAAKSKNQVITLVVAIRCCLRLSVDWCFSSSPSLPCR